MRTLHTKICFCVFADQDQPEGRGPTVENLQKKIKRLESDLEKRPEKKDVKDDHGKVAATWSNNSAVICDCLHYSDSLLVHRPKMKLCVGRRVRNGRPRRTR